MKQRSDAEIVGLFDASEVSPNAGIVRHQAFSSYDAAWAAQARAAQVDELPPNLRVQAGGRRRRRKTTRRRQRGSGRNGWLRVTGSMRRKNFKVAATLRLRQRS